MSWRLLRNWLLYRMNWTWKRSKSLHSRTLLLSLTYTRKRSKTWPSSSKTCKRTKSAYSTCKMRWTCSSKSGQTTRTLRSVWQPSKASLTQPRIKGSLRLHRLHVLRPEWSRWWKRNPISSNNSRLRGLESKRWSHRSKYLIDRSMRPIGRLILHRILVPLMQMRIIQNCSMNR